MVWTDVYVDPAGQGWMTRAGVSETGWSLMRVVPTHRVFAEATAMGERAWTLFVLMLGALGVFYLLFFVYLCRRSRRLAVELRQPIHAVGAAITAIRNGRSVAPRKDVAIREIDRTLRRVVEVGNTLQTRNAALARAAQDADAANRATSGFLANMSHELRTPLNAIIGFAEVIENQMVGPAGNPRYAEYGRDIRTSGQHLLALVNDILDLAKIDAGRFVPEEETLDLNALAGARMVSGPDGRGCAPATLVDELNARVRADRRALTQIPLNLLPNAAKFTPHDGEIRVTLALNAAGAPEIRVADTGAGIPEDRIDAALERFVQLGRRADIACEGTGLGLPLATALAEAHDGRLEIASRSGHGTTIVVTLPAWRLLDAPAATRIAASG